MSIPFITCVPPHRELVALPWINNNVELVIEQGFPATVGTRDCRMYDHCVCVWVGVSMDVCGCVGV